MAVKIFFCYAHEDEMLLNQLKAHLKSLQRQEYIEVWHDRDIGVGTEWEQEIKEQLNTAQIILLLVSPDFMASDYCYGIEMKKAMERHERREATIIPIILRPVYWQVAPFGKLRALPDKGIPVISQSWHNSDEAFLNVVNGIKNIVEVSSSPSLQLPQETKDELLNKGSLFLGRKEYDNALKSFQQATRLDPSFSPALVGVGNAFYGLSRYHEALEAYKQAIIFDPNSDIAYSGKGDTLFCLKLYKDALTAYEQAISLNPNNITAYHGKSIALCSLKVYEEALTTSEHLINIDSNDATAYDTKGKALFGLRFYEYALVSCQQALQLDPNNMDFKKNQERIQRRLKFYQFCKRRIRDLVILLSVIGVYQIIFYIYFYRSIRSDGVIDGGDLLNTLIFFQIPVLILFIVFSAILFIVWIIKQKIQPQKAKEDLLP